MNVFWSFIIWTSLVNLTSASSRNWFPDARVVPSQNTAICAPMCSFNAAARYLIAIKMSTNVLQLDKKTCMINSNQLQDVWETDVLYGSGFTNLTRQLFAKVSIVSERPTTLSAILKCNSCSFVRRKRAMANDKAHAVVVPKANWSTIFLIHDR